MDNKIKLKMTLEDIRSAIDVNKDTWDNMDTTNCYAYALGLDINENLIRYGVYQPGVIGGKRLSFFDVKTLINGIYDDLNALGVSFKEVSHSVDFSRDEWKIALYITRAIYGIYDFHFLRQRRNGLWYHKSGYTGIIKNTDDNCAIISSLDDCYFRNKEYITCYTLKLK